LIDQPLKIQHLGNVTSSVTWQWDYGNLWCPRCGQLPYVYLARLRRFKDWMILKSRPWPLVVTWPLDCGA